MPLPPACEPRPLPPASQADGGGAGGIEARRHTRSRRRRPGLAAAENAVQDLRQVSGRPVLHAIDMQGLFGQVEARSVEALDPALGVVEVGRTRGHHQDAVEALDRHDLDRAQERVLAEAARQPRPQRPRRRPAPWRRRASPRRRGTAARKHPQRGFHLPHRRMFQREQADGHAFEQVDVESRNDALPAFGLGTVACQHQQVAHRVDPDQRFGRHHGPQDGRHFRRADVLQRNDDGAVAGCQRAVADLLRNRNDPPQRFRPAHVIGAAAVARHHEAVGQQRAFQEIGGLDPPTPSPLVARVTLPLTGGWIT